MIYAIVAEFLVIVGAFIVLMADNRRFDRERADWRDERRELLNRVQAPTRLPVREDAGDYTPREPDEWNRVGEIRIDPKYGLEDEVEFLG
jgi:hypothetical protein